MHGLKIGALLLAVVMLLGLWAAPAALAEEKPRRGGVLRVAIAGDPPSPAWTCREDRFLPAPRGP